jgi:hypothetical protein
VVLAFPGLVPVNAAAGAGSTWSASGTSGAVQGDCSPYRLSLPFDLRVRVWPRARVPSWLFPRHSEVLGGGCVTLTVGRDRVRHRLGRGLAVCVRPVTLLAAGLQTARCAEGCDEAGRAFVVIDGALIPSTG